MMRCFVLLVPMILLTACGRSVQRVELSKADAGTHGLAPGFAAAGDGTLVCGGSAGPYRFDPTQRTITGLIAGPAGTVRDLAITATGAVLVLQPEAVAVVMEGVLVEAVALGQGGAERLSVDGEVAWIATRTAGRSRLLRWRITGPGRGQVERIAESADPISALCAVRGGCLIASGAAVHKVFTPGSDRQVDSALLLALDRPVVGLAADASAGVVYVSTDDTTLAWTGETLVPLLPVGGALACASGTLAVRCPDGQIRRQTRAATLVQQLAQAMTGE